MEWLQGATGLTQMSNGKIHAESGMSKFKGLCGGPGVARKVYHWLQVVFNVNGLPGNCSICVALGPWWRRSKGYRMSKSMLKSSPCQKLNDCDLILQPNDFFRSCVQFHFTYVQGRFKLCFYQAQSCYLQNLSLIHFVIRVPLLAPLSHPIKTPPLGVLH